MKLYTLALAFLTLSLVSAAAGSKPNVILILADDMAVGDFASVNGGRSRTPRLDKLAQQSVVFENAYSASCVCAPARAALLTGRYPHRTGVVTLNMYDYPRWTRLRHDERTIAELLKSVGYTTGLVGKWHCGLGKDYSPLAHGFDEFEGFAGTKNVSYFDYQLQVGDRELQVNDGYLTEDLSRRAIQFVRRHQSEPFFLHLAHYAPHRPLLAPKPLVDQYIDEGLEEHVATIYAMIEIMDRGIGELLDELDTLQIAEKTIVVFASDNGPDPVTGTRFNRGLRGTKYQVYEGGIRIPLLVHWSNWLNPHRVRQPVHGTDIYPTIAELCGVDVPRQPTIDGASFASLLSATKINQRDFFWQWNRGQPDYTHNAAYRRGPWKLVRPFVTRKVNPPSSEESPMLFNLDDDPNETSNVADRYPDRVRLMGESLSRLSQSVEQSRERP